MRVIRFLMAHQHN